MAAQARKPRRLGNDGPGIGCDYCRRDRHGDPASCSNRTCSEGIAAFRGPAMIPPAQIFGAMLEWRTLSPAVQWTIAGIFVLLLFATLVVRLLSRIRKETDWTELRQRVNSWWVIAGVFALAI